MNYKLTRPSCGKRHKPSDHKANKYQDKKGITYEWDCPHCGGVIAARFWGRQ